MARLRAYERLRNPAWVESALNRSGEEVAVAPARPERVPGCEPAQVWARNRSCYEELGTGAYGTVVQTDDRNTVVKLTTDKSEAQFAAASLEYGLHGDAMVRYQYAVRLPVDLDPSGFGARSRRRTVPYGTGKPIYGLWRDAAEKVGMIELRRAESDALDAYSTSIDRITDFSGGWEGAQTSEDFWGLAAAAKELLAAHRRRIPLYDDLMGPGMLAQELGSLGVVVETAALLKSAHKGLDEMQAGGRLAPLARTLRRMLKKDIVFLDVHEQNLGWLNDQAWGVTDPGGAVFLSGAYLDVDRLLDEGV